MQFTFSMYISFEDFLPYYRGYVKNVEVRDVRGKLLHINGKYFRPFVTTSGIQGQFVLQLDASGKFISLNKI
ncbi:MULTISPECIES: DUF2835 domain-containing protein [Shewanella]|uniref:DUF2835 family protein n=1 Tax=Shewanella japonica TaxID=93973 RepID=A0ABM6JKL5_9GAMM|nr:MULTISPECIES: DUF2835 domain-containing protein [Shewanella]ARD22108.1 hypothetical protein SJ2017_1800 [Shewanella japonica]KPZ70931.1 hypothetical protein AN944_02029 [Shewanella sp. P1-14-1]